MSVECTGGGASWGRLRELGLDTSARTGEGTRSEVMSMSGEWATAADMSVRGGGGGSWSAGVRGGGGRGRERSGVRGGGGVCGKEGV